MRKIFNFNIHLFGLLIAFVALGLGCEPATENMAKVDVMPLERVIDIGEQSRGYHSEHLDMDISIGRVIYKGQGEYERIIFERGVNLKAQNNKGELILSLKANTGIVIYPYKTLTIRNVLIESEDGTEIEGKELNWQGENEAYPIEMNGDIRILTPNVIMQGDGFHSNHLFTKYRLDNVRGVTEME